MKILARRVGVLTSQSPLSWIINKPGADTQPGELGLSNAEITESFQCPGSGGVGGEREDLKCTGQAIVQILYFSGGEQISVVISRKPVAAIQKNGIL